MFKITLLILSLLVFSHCNAKESLLILGTVFAQGDVCNGAKVYAFDGDNEVGFDVTPLSGNFYITIPKDKKVILSIEKPGFLAKQVVVDTNAEDFPNRRMTFFCDVDLLEEHVFQGVDKKILEEPIGIVYFNPADRLFVLDKFKAYWTKRDLRLEKRKNRRLRHPNRFRFFKD